MAKSKERGSLYHPRHWPSWLVIGLWYLSSFLPYRWLCQLGRPIGWLLFALGRSRTAVGRRNLALCFPELSPAQRERLLKRNFEQMGITLMETGFAWWASDRRIDRISRVEGLEQLIERQQRGEGALLISFHFLAIDLTARIVGRHGDFHALYKIQGNRVFEAVSKRIRERHHVYIIPHKQVQELLDRDFPRVVTVGDATYEAEYDLARSSVVLKMVRGARRDPPPLGYLPRFPGMRITVEAGRSMWVVRQGG